MEVSVLVVVSLIVGGFSFVFSFGALAVFLLAFLKQLQYNKFLSEVDSVHKSMRDSLKERKISSILMQKIKNKWGSAESLRTAERIQKKAEIKSESSKKEASEKFEEQEQSETNKSGGNIYEDIDLMDRVPSYVLREQATMTDDSRQPWTKL